MNSWNKSDIFEIIFQLKAVEHHFSHSRVKNADSKSKPCGKTSDQHYLHYEDAHPNRTKDMLIVIKPAHNFLITSLKQWKMKIETPRSHFLSCAFPLFCSFPPLPKTWPGQSEPYRFPQWFCRVPSTVLGVFHTTSVWNNVFSQHWVPVRIVIHTTAFHLCRNKGLIN